MANLEVLALDTVTPQIRAPGAGDGYSVPRDMTLASGTTLTAPTVNATTVDATNVEVTNVKAKDGTAAITIADSTGAVTVGAGATINGGAVFNETGADVDFRIESDTNANAFVLDGATGNVGIGGAAGAGELLTIAGTLPSSGTLSRGLQCLGVMPSSTTTFGMGYSTFLLTEAASFTLSNLSHFYADQGTIGAGSTVTNQYGFYVNASLTGATNNYGFYSNIASGSGRWNFYAAGTARNYFAGNVGIGVSPVSVLHIAGANGAPSTTANNQFLTIEANTSVQLAIGSEATANNVWLQTKQSTNSGNAFPLLLNPVAGNVVVGQAVATTATDGFLYVPTCAGAPTGTPTSYAGRAPIVVDTTNNKLYFYSNGTWRDAGP